MRNEPGKYIRVALAGVSLLPAGCGEVLGLQCPDIGGYAVMAQARDARTSAPLTEGVTLVIREGMYADSARSPVLAAGPERPGTYDVRVHKAGYQEWTRQSVKVTRGGGCERLRTVRVTALLQPVDSPQ